MTEETWPATSTSQLAAVLQRCAGRQACLLILGGALALSAAPSSLRADQVEMLNGDRYVGTVLSLNTNTLLLHSEVLGDVTLPRGKVALITLRPAAVTNRASSPVAVNSAPRQLPTARTNAAPEQLPAGFGLLAANTNLVAKVTGPLLDGAGPEAKAKFNELFGGLMSGTVSVDDIRAQARSAVEQVKALKKESGDDTGMLDGYLTILEKFLGETPAGATTNAAASKKQL